MSQSTPPALDMAATEELLASFTPNQPKLMILIFIRNKAMPKDAEKAHFTGLHTLLAQTMKPFNGQCASGKGRYLTTLHGPPDMYRAILKQPQLQPHIASLRKHVSLSTNI